MWTSAILMFFAAVTDSSTGEPNAEQCPQKSSAKAINQKFEAIFKSFEICLIQQKTGSSLAS